jgi:hypothetical protein
MSGSLLVLVAGRYQFKEALTSFPLDHAAPKTAHQRRQSPAALTTLNCEGRNVDMPLLPTKRYIRGPLSPADAGNRSWGIEAADKFRLLKFAPFDFESWLEAWGWPVLNPEREKYK